MKMKMKMKRTKFTTAFFAALLAIFAAMAFADEAAARPDWVTVRYTGSEVHSPKGKAPNDDKSFYKLVLKFDIINDSKNGDIITTIFDKKVDWSGLFTIHQMTHLRAEEWKSANWKVLYAGRDAEPAKGEWYPGQVYKYDHVVTLDKVIKPYDGSWQKTNEAIYRGGGSTKFHEWGLDFQVKSKK